jgi:MerR family transcriptional regulator, heat shock protein HspR
MPEDEQTVFSISHIAKLLHVHPQTLRFYERAGFVTPVRARGDTRLYSHQDIARLRLILHLTRDMGVNLAGVEIILRMQHQLEHLQDEIAHLRQLLAVHGQQPGVEGVQTQALIKATPRKLVKIK